MTGKRPKPARAQDDKLDEALEETFPASDPIAVEPVDGPLPAPSKQAPGGKD